MIAPCDKPPESAPFAEATSTRTLLGVSVGDNEGNGVGQYTTCTVTCDDTVNFTTPTMSEINENVVAMINN